MKSIKPLEKVIRRYNYVLFFGALIVLCLIILCVHLDHLSYAGVVVTPWILYLIHWYRRTADLIFLKDSLRYGDPKRKAWAEETLEEYFKKSLLSSFKFKTQVLSK
jgi:hypothetical protein